MAATTLSPKSAIPNQTFEHVIFTEATPHQRVLSWQLNGASWAPPMSIDEYVGREQTLSETLLSRDGGTRYYVLHPRSDPETIVSACEVTSKRVLVATPGADEGVRVVDGYAIASVFTNPLYRGKGMAGYLLKRVKEAADGEMGCELGVLYSDIGRKYYTELGWRDWRSPQVVFELDKNWEEHGMEGFEFLEEGEVERLCERDVEGVRKRFDRLAENGEGGKTYVAFLPDWKQISWHFARDKYVARMMTGREVRNRGVRTKDGRSWVLWDHDLREKKLKILRIVLDEDEDEQKRESNARGLLTAALREAKAWEVKKVLVWAPSEVVSRVAIEIWRNDKGGKVKITFEEREDGSIPSLRWKGAENKEAVWENNEYYAWC